MQSANAYSNNKQDFKSNHGGTFNTLTNVQRSERRDLNHSCHGCSDMRGRLLDSIKIEHNNKLKSRGGQGFLKHELQASDVRLNCRESIKMISKTKKYLSGEFKNALSNNNKRTDFVLEDHNNMLEAEEVAKECVNNYD